MYQNKTYDVIVIGGGASGMMASISAARYGASVLLLEKNARLGEKLRITGGGRCNIWNEEYDTGLLLSNYGDSGKFLHGAFARFGLRDTMNFFNNELKLTTKVEQRKRAFPQSENAEDVAECLIQEIHELDVDVVTSCDIDSVEHVDATITSINCGKTSYTAKNYILSTGGFSRPETGSTGDGFKWLHSMGHTTANPKPTITPLKVSEPWVRALSGTTMSGIRMTFNLNGKKAFRIDGDVLCTHFGVSGPAILNNAYRVAELLSSGKVTATIDLYPNMDEKELDLYCIENLSTHGAKQLKNTIKYIAPAGMSSAVVTLIASLMDTEMNTGELNKEQRLLITRLLKAMPMTIDKLMGFEKAVVADGGLDLKDVDTKTMRSRIISNLFITGDLMNINRSTGGYSLQLCWTTGYIAGQSATE